MTGEDTSDSGSTRPRGAEPEGARKTRPGRESGANTRPRPEKRVLGWREWIGLPDFGIKAMKAKLDTGARTSSLHAFKMAEFQEDGRRMLRFEIHSVQRNDSVVVPAAAELVDERLVRNTGGQQEMRPVIVCRVEVGGRIWPVEVTLTRRDEMGFRMLLGRQALKGSFVVDPGRSFLGRKPPRIAEPPRALPASATRGSEEGEPGDSEEE